ncbi:hypothetical protein AB0I22_36185 [Streptomyces sp. NPDC050610]|uniref:hypothetical protein n=1 Tax=Streptomyces sp. NPDC050610 TaxID=3157097 RepID=UPI003436F3A8
MSNKKWHRTVVHAAALTALTAGGVLIPSASASAGTAYEWDLCNASDGECLGIFYSSDKGTKYIDSACFLTNRSVPDHWGRTENGGSVAVRYEYRNKGYNGGPTLYFSGAGGVGAKCLPNGYGGGEAIKNNAASAANQDYYPHTIYFNSGYGGAAQTVPSGRIYNLNSALKNQNASSSRG